jgi:hypothetical protein
MHDELDALRPRRNQHDVPATKAPRSGAIHLGSPVVEPC